MRIVALDIGGTLIKSGIIDNGELTLKIKTPANAHLGGPYIIETAKKIISGYRDFNGIGISTAGQVDSDQGLIRYANQNILDYTGMRIQEILQKEFNVPVAVENDVNAVAVGEAVYGAGLNEENKTFLCLTYGTGIGGAIVFNGEVFKGASFSAGEFGHIITHGSTDEKGYYEKYASVNTLIKNVLEVMPGLDSGKKIFAKIDNPAIKEIVDSWITEILYGLASLIHVFNPSLVILGGGVMQNNYIIKEIQERINNFIMPSFTDVKIIQAVLGNEAGLWGAAHLAGLKVSMV
ncbi:MAG: ROK family protein [Treponema sp.]|nr:ROK family protein [Treponema sp.]